MITYVTDLQAITSDKLQGFFVGWLKPPSPEKHLEMLKGSTHCVLAIDDETGNVVGFVNALSDGVLAAYLPLLEVLPEYQGRGIGQELMRRILEEVGELYMTDLVCDEDMQPFYKPLGFKSYRAMIIRNFDRQEGR